MTTNPDDHRGRALDLDDMAASARSPEHGLVYATRALTHATLAGLLEPAAECPTAGLDELATVITEWSRAAALPVATPHDVAARFLAERLWAEGYRPTWTTAAPQAVGA